MVSWLSKLTKLFLTYIEMDKNTSGMGALVISVYEKYGVVLFEGAVQLTTLFPKTSPSNSIPQCGTIRRCDTNRVNTILLSHTFIK